MIYIFKGYFNRSCISLSPYTIWLWQRLPSKTHAHMYICAPAHIRIYTHTRTHTQRHTHTHTHKHLFLSITRVCVCVCVCVCVRERERERFTILGEIFAYNPTVKVVTFHLHGWCILGVLLLPPFTHLGHECQDLLSPYDGTHVSTA